MEQSKLNMPSGRILDKKKIIIISSVVLALVVIVIFFTNFTSFSVKENVQKCVDKCDFEGQICEDAKIFECVLGENGCKNEVLIKECAEGAVCSKLNNDCYEPQLCDDDFHICISDALYQTCENGKTVEGAENKKCPEGLMCNRNPNIFAVCVEKDY